MISENESKIGYVYAIFIVVLLILVTMFLVCGFQVLGGSSCETFNNSINWLSEKFK